MKLSDVDVDKTIDFKGNQERMRMEKQQKKENIYGALFVIIFIIGLVFIAFIEKVM